MKMEKVEVAFDPDTLSLSIYPIVMVKVLENDYVAFESEGENKASDLNSFEVTQVMPEILEVVEGYLVKRSKLTYLLLNRSEQSRIFMPKFSQDILDLGSIYVHNESHHLLNSSIVMGLPAGFLLNAFNFLTYSSLKGSSSIGYQSILSQNSWSSADSSPVLMNSSNMSRFINLTTALANNSASNLGSLFISTSPISITNNNIDSEYINTNTFSLSKINGTTRLHEINTEEENDDHVMVLENYGLKEKIERR